MAGEAKVVIARLLAGYLTHSKRSISQQITRIDVGFAAVKNASVNYRVPRTFVIFSSDKTDWGSHVILTLKSEQIAYIIL